MGDTYESTGPIGVTCSGTWNRCSGGDGEDVTDPEWRTAPAGAPLGVAVTVNNDEKVVNMFTMRSVRFHETDKGEMAFVRLMPEGGKTLSDVVPAVAFGDAVEELRTIGRQTEVDVDLVEGKKGMIVTDIMPV